MYMLDKDKAGSRHVSQKIEQTIATPLHRVKLHIPHYTNYVIFLNILYLLLVYVYVKNELLYCNTKKLMVKHINH